MHYNVHSDQFDKISTPDGVSGTAMVNMNPSHYDKEQERYFSPFMEPLEVKSENLSLPSKEQDIIKKATILPSYEKYQEYLKTETEKPGYKFAERISNMEYYSKENPTMSYDEYMTENPNLLNLDKPQPIVPVQSMTENRQPVTDLPTQGMMPTEGFVQTGNPYQDIFNKTMPIIQKIYGKVQENYPILPNMDEVVNPSTLPDTRNTEGIFQLLPEINTPTTSPPYFPQNEMISPYINRPIGPEEMY